jgi:uncharacterized protein (DUF1697 family)
MRRPWPVLRNDADSTLQHGQVRARSRPNNGFPQGVNTMPRYIAFLRAINVGGHTVKMDRLREIFESLGFANVETFIASGNVVFETAAPDTAALEARIASALQAALGYEVATFLRTEAELARIASCSPFPQAQLDAAQALNIAFLADPLDAEARRKLMALKTEIDDFATHEREIYWLCRKKQSESTFSNAVLEKTLRRQATLRGANTVQKMAAKYAASGWTPPAMPAV